MKLSLFVPGQLTQRTNGSLSRASRWRIKAWRDMWHERTAMAWAVAERPRSEWKSVVTFTAYVGRLWDDDNLPAAIKPIRDEAVKLMLGTDDGPKCGHCFHYEQVVSPRRGVLIEIEPRQPLESTAAPAALERGPHNTRSRKRRA